MTVNSHSFATSYQVIHLQKLKTSWSPSISHTFSKQFVSFLPSLKLTFIAPEYRGPLEKENPIRNHPSLGANCWCQGTVDTSYTPED